MVQKKHLYIGVTTASLRWCRKAPLRAPLWRPLYFLIGLSMGRVAVFVDAGYFWVQSCNAVNGSYNSRQQLSVNFERLREELLKEVHLQFPAEELLRVYWYDGPGNQTGTKTAEHRSIDDLNDFKLRLGTRNGVGQQKGVDGLIIADLISLTQQKAIASALLVSGDADIAPGVVAAQGMGLRIHLLSIGAPRATSPYLSAEVDSKKSWQIADVFRFAAAASIVLPLSVSPPPIVPTQPIQSTGAVLDFQNMAQSAKAQIMAGSSAASLAMAQGSFKIPADVDRALLAVARAEVGRNLEEGEKRQLRVVFRTLL